MLFDNNPNDAFDQARFKSLLGDLRSVVTRKENRLLSFDKISKRLNLKNQRYLGIKPVPTDSIVGSVDRYRDFDRHFLPKKGYLENRWSKIYKAYSMFEDLPLIKLYKVGEMYFVVDGNHRVSVARKMGVKYIDAEITEFLTRFPVTRQMDPKDMFILTERENFLELTGLSESRPQIKIRLTIPGKYDVLLNQINQYMYDLNQNREKKLNFKQAAAIWYDRVYEPAIKKIEKSHIVDIFTHRTKSDLLVWLYEHQQNIQDKYGKQINLSQAMDDFSQRYSGSIWSNIKAGWLRLFKKHPV
ncbi:MAG: hypothetical protein U5N58_12485 [Actinomycetota bacterium]|nr:hypothetical protein [Actinomycetota bacterium]